MPFPPRGLGRPSRRRPQRRRGGGREAVGERAAAAATTTTTTTTTTSPGGGGEGAPGGAQVNTHYQNIFKKSRAISLCRSPLSGLSPRRYPSPAGASASNSRGDLTSGLPRKRSVFFYSLKKVFLTICTYFSQAPLYFKNQNNITYLHLYTQFRTILYPILYNR